MIDLIVKSKIRKKIIKLFFSRKNKEFYLSELAGLIGASVGNAQRELDCLTRIGLTKTEKRANLRYYSLDETNPLLREVKKIFNQTASLEDDLRSLVKEAGDIKFAFIFGSYAKGDFSSKSDIDLCLIGNPNEDKLIEKINFLERQTGREINYHLYGQNDFKKRNKKNSFLKNITQKYLLLTNNQDEFKKLF